jgi:hypothetical protein
MQTTLCRKSYRESYGESNGEFVRVDGPLSPRYILLLNWNSISDTCWGPKMLVRTLRAEAGLKKNTFSHALNVGHPPLDSTTTPQNLQHQLLPTQASRYFFLLLNWRSHRLYPPNEKWLNTALFTSTKFDVAIPGAWLARGVEMAGLVARSESHANRFRH